MAAMGQIGPLGQAHADGEAARIADFFIPVPIPLLSDNRATVGGAGRAAATADIGFGL